MKTSELLKAAEAFLWDGMGERKWCELCLCHAIQEAAEEHDEHWDQCLRATDFIEARLKPHRFYTTWAEAQGLLPADWKNDAAHWAPVIQANRLNWLRELQREFREKGD